MIEEILCWDTLYFTIGIPDYFTIGIPSHFTIGIVRKRKGKRRERKEHEKGKREGKGMGRAAARKFYDRREGKEVREK